MLFASTDLAARIERADACLMRDTAAAAAHRRPGTGAFATPLAGGFATFTAPGSPINKIAGLGFAGPLDPAELEAVERAYAERGVAVQVELACLAQPGIGTLLSGRSYALVGFENVLGRRVPSEPPLAPAQGIAVSESPEPELAAWLDVVVTGFASPDQQGVPSHEQIAREEHERVAADMAAVEGFLRYLARRDAAVAGGASMRLFDGVAQLCGAATLPEQRRRGVQSALLAARLEAARRAGCDVAVVTTQPGSKSQENVQKQGFELLYTRAILVRQPQR
jgi:ribosomal protein S18 acetylase RimI-like enzyme